MVFVAGGKLTSQRPRRKASKRMEASTAAASHPAVLGPVASPSDQTSWGSSVVCCLVRSLENFVVGGVTLRNKRLVVNSIGEILCFCLGKFNVYSIQIGGKILWFFNADARNWATVERSLFFKPIDIGWNPSYAYCTWIPEPNQLLGGGFKYSLFPPGPGEMIRFE